MATLKQKLEAGLKSLGAVEEPKRATGKYTAWWRNELNREGRKMYYFVGRKGALRKGTCGSDSVSCEGTEVYRVVMRAGEQAVEKDAGKKAEFTEY